MVPNRSLGLLTDGICFGQIGSIAGYGVARLHQDRDVVKMPKEV